MTIESAADDSILAARIASYLLRTLPNSRDITVDSVRRQFGGNARRVWSFDAEGMVGGTKTRLPCVMLSQVEGRHVESQVAWEYRVLSSLAGHRICAPAAIALDEDGWITGAPSIILERVRGDAGAAEFLNSADSVRSRTLTAELADITSDLHGFDWTAAGLGGDAAKGPLAQIEHWERTFLQHRLEPLPLLVHLFGWLKNHVPEPSRLCLVHGDLRAGNFLYDGERVTALLDWEMAHIGDPAEDIAWIYRKLWSPERFLSIDRFVERYSARAGAHIPRRNIAFYRIFSELKFAAISLTAAASFAHGKTDNLRHADRAAKVPETVRLCFQWIAAESWEASHAAA